MWILIRCQKGRITKIVCCILFDFIEGETWFQGSFIVPKCRIIFKLLFLHLTLNSLHFFFLKRRHHLFFKGSIHQRICSEKSVTIRAELGLGLGRFPFKLRVENGLAIVWLKPPLLLTLVRVWQVLIGGYLHTIFTYDHKGRALENLLEFFRRTLTNYFMLVFYVTSILSIEELHGWSCDTGAIQKCFCLHICGVFFTISKGIYTICQIFFLYLCVLW